jgi:hypothetical protein
MNKIQELREKEMDICLEGYRLACDGIETTHYRNRIKDLINTTCYCKANNDEEINIPGFEGTREQLEKININ